MSTLIEDIARFTVNVRYADIPDQDRSSIRALVLDTIGCALGAVGCEPARMLQDMLRPASGPGDRATLIGSTHSVSLDSAILYNGCLVRYLDYMDVYWARDICHPSENIPVALAAAEAAGCDGRKLMEAIAVAYEVQIRLADAFSLQDMCMHHVSAAGFVVPLLLGKLWDLPADKLAHACALGGFRHLTLAALVEGQLSMAKAVGYPLPASECVLATRLATRGFTGPLLALESLWRASHAHHAADLREALDLAPGTGSVGRVSLKQFPVQFALQAPIEATLTLRAEMHGDPKAVDALQVEVPERVCQSTADPEKFRPANRETADHSLPCCVALAWLDGKVDAGQFDGGRWRDDDVTQLLPRVHVRAAPDLQARCPTGRPARVTVRLRDGTTRTTLVETPLGDARRPMGQADIERKFLAQAVPVLGGERADQIVRLVHHLDDLADVGDLCRALVPAGTPALRTDR